MAWLVGGGQACSRSIRCCISSHLVLEASSSVKSPSRFSSLSMSPISNCGEQKRGDRRLGQRVWSASNEMVCRLVTHASNCTEKRVKFQNIQVPKLFDLSVTVVLGKAAHSQTNGMKAVITKILSMLINRDYYWKGFINEIVQ